MIPYGRQNITEADVDAVLKVLRSDFLTQGPAVPRFEAAVAEKVGARHGVAVNSATSALHIACLALGLGEGEGLWTVPNTFVASANCGRFCGARVDFVDIDPRTWNISVPKLADKLVRARRDGRLPRIVVPVHFSGQPTEQEAIFELAREFGFRILEDASHSIGASRNGSPVGSGKWSDITVFSFHPVKVITTMEGGMALSNDGDLAERMRLLRSHGITRDPSLFETPSVGAWYYEQQLLGFNYRLTDVQAALGMSQLDRLDAIIERRNELAGRYSAALAGTRLELPFVDPANLSAFHLYVVRLPETDDSGHRRAFDTLRQKGVGVNVHYLPVHLQPYYRNLGFQPGQFPESERHGRTAITLPLYPTMTDADQEVVVNAIHEVLGR